LEIPKQNKSKGALDSQLQVIKLTSCLPMVGGFSLDPLDSSTNKTDRHNTAEILNMSNKMHELAVDQFESLMFSS
jgi:hypothetical protein